MHMEEGQRGAGTLDRSPQAAYRRSCLLALTLLTTQTCQALVSTAPGGERWQDRAIQPGGPLWAAQGMGLSSGPSRGPRRTGPHPLCGAGPSAGLEKAGVWSAWLLAIGSLSGFLLRASSVWNSNGKNPALASGPCGSQIPGLVVCRCMGPRLDSGHPHPLPGMGGSHLLLAEPPPFSCMLGV